MLQNSEQNMLSGRCFTWKRNNVLCSILKIDLNIVNYTKRQRHNRLKPLLHSNRFILNLVVKPVSSIENLCVHRYVE